MCLTLKDVEQWEDYKEGKDTNAEETLWGPVLEGFHIKAASHSEGTRRARTSNFIQLPPFIYVFAKHFVYEMHINPKNWLVLGLLFLYSYVGLYARLLRPFVVHVVAL